MSQSHVHFIATIPGYRSKTQNRIKCYNNYKLFKKSNMNFVSNKRAKSLKRPKQKYKRWSLMSKYKN